MKLEKGARRYMLLYHTFSEPGTSPFYFIFFVWGGGSRCSSVVRAFAHGAMGRRIDPSWGGPIELFLVQARDPRLV